MEEAPNILILECQGLMKQNGFLHLKNRGPPSMVSYHGVIPEYLYQDNDPQSFYKVKIMYKGSSTKMALNSMVSCK